MTQNVSLETFSPIAVMERAALSHAVNIVALAVEKRNAIPILSNFSITGTGESLVIVGTDLDHEIRVTVPGAAMRGFPSLRRRTW